MWKRCGHVCLFVFGFTLMAFGVIVNLSTEIIKASEVVSLFFVGIGLIFLTGLVRKKAI